MHQSFRVIALAPLLLAACAQMPTSGPSDEQVRRAADAGGANGVQIVDVDDAVTRALVANRQQRLFSETLGAENPNDLPVGAGDALEVVIWEAPPATLFGGLADARQTGTSTARNTTLPEQVVDREGLIYVPFAGRVPTLGRTTRAIESEITRRLTGKANQPEVLVRRTRNASATVTVVGDVGASVRMPLTSAGERLLDALAAAGGVRQPVNKMTLQVTRGNSFYTLPLDQVIRDPRQNVPLRPGDVVTALFQTMSFTALGATGKNDEIPFEAQGITLSQALGRAGGLLDSRSSAQGVFIFRFEPPNALPWPRQPVMATPENMVPVVYRVDLRNPASFFAMQNFAIQNKDVLYVSNAPAAELQKVLNIVFSALFPVLNVIQVTK